MLCTFSAQEKLYLSPSIVLNMGRIFNAEEAEAVKQQAPHRYMGAMGPARGLVAERDADQQPQPGTRTQVPVYKVRHLGADQEPQRSGSQTCTAAEVDQDGRRISGGKRFET